MGDIEINFDDFHVTSLISDYNGTLYDIEFKPKEKYTDLNKFIGDLRMHVSSIGGAVPGSLDVKMPKIRPFLQKTLPFSNVFFTA